MRVVANLYPALGRHLAAAPMSDGLFAGTVAAGVHEVIIDCPRHERWAGNLTVENVRELFATYQARLLALRDDPRVEYGLTDLDGSRPDCWRYLVEVQDAGLPADVHGYR